MRDWWSTSLEWLWSTRDLDLGSGYTAYRRASLMDLYLHTECHWNRKNFFLDGLTAGASPSSRSCDTKSRTNIKTPARWNLDIVLYFTKQWSFASSHCKLRRRLTWKSAIFGTSEAPWPWSWIRSYGIPSFITHWPLGTYQISLKSDKRFVDGRTDVPTQYWRMDISPSTVIRSTRRSRPKKLQPYSLDKKHYRGSSAHIQREKLLWPEPWRRSAVVVRKLDQPLSWLQQKSFLVSL